MARHDTLTEIERDVLDQSVPLATAMRQCLILAGKSGSEPLRDWATRELKGYLGEADLPDYRVINAPLRLDGLAGNYKVTGEQLAPSALPDFAREYLSERVELRQGVGDIELMSEQPEVVRLQPQMASDLARLMNAERDQPHRHIDCIYWAVAPVALRGVLDQIRTALTQLVAELRAGMSGEDDIPSREAANQAVQVVVTGKRSRVNVTTAQATGNGTTATAATPSEPKHGLWTLWRRIGAFIVGLAGVSAAVVAIIELH